MQIDTGTIVNDRHQKVLTPCGREMRSQAHGSQPISFVIFDCGCGYSFRSHRDHNEILDGRTCGDTPIIFTDDNMTVTTKPERVQ